MWEHIAGVTQPVSEHDMSCTGTEQYDFGGAVPLSPSVHWVAQQMVTQSPGMHANIHACCQVLQGNSHACLEKTALVGMYHKCLRENGRPSQTMLQRESCAIPVECHTCCRLCHVLPSLQSHRGKLDEGFAPVSPSGLVPACPSALLVSPACWDDC